MSDTVSNTEDHRPRVAAQRRERTRRRLIESALVAFSRHGIGVTVIPEVIASAGVSQGSFYNYFRTNAELLEAVGDALNLDMFSSIENAIGAIEDPLARMSTGIRSYLHLVRSIPVVAQFLAGAGVALVDKKSPVFDHFPADLKAAVKSGRISEANVEVAMELVAGAGLMAVHRIAKSKTPRDYPERITRAILRSLAVPEQEAVALTSTALPKTAIEPESLLEKAKDWQSLQTPSR